MAKRPYIEGNAEERINNLSMDLDKSPSKILAIIIERLSDDDIMDMVHKYELEKIKQRRDRKIK